MTTEQFSPGDQVVTTDGKSGPGTAVGTVIRVGKLMMLVRFADGDRTVYQHEAFHTSK